MKKPKGKPKRSRISTISEKILDIFRKKGGVYGIASRNKLQGTNLYERIRRCDNALERIQSLLRLVGHELKWQIVEVGKKKKDKGKKG